MQIITKTIGEIIPYERNPRKNDDAVKGVAESIKQFGFKIPVIIDKDNVIVAGHTRIKAAKLLGIEEIPCIIADDLTKEQIQAFRLADNKVAEKAEWDLELLDAELQELLEFDFDMADFGFELTEEEEEQMAAEEDDYEEVLPEEPKSKLGDIYQLGDHILMCGDSTSIEQVQILVGGGAG